jgi:hypothetical protein
MTAEGHTFVLRGDLRRLLADAWLLPADKGLNISRSWRGHAPDVDLISLPADWDHDGTRVAKVPGTQPVCWIANVGRYRQPPEWYAEAARQFIRHAADDLAGNAPATGRPVPLLALPLVGTGFGGGAAISGHVTQAVIEAVATETAAAGVDTCIVCWEDAPYAALQRARADLLETYPHASAGWTELGSDLLAVADALGHHALDHRYEQTRAALAGIVQALHVRQAVRRKDAPTEPFGTAVVLRDEPLMDELWRGDIDFLSMVDRSLTPAEAARRVELLLDRIAFIATDDTAHLLDPAYDGILTEQERWLRDSLHALRYQQPVGVETTKAWNVVEQLLRRFGDSP